MPQRLRFLRRSRFLLIGLLVVVVLVILARRPRRLTKEEFQVAGVWALTSPTTTSPIGAQHLTLYAGRRYDLEGPAGPGGLSARESGEWAFANGRLRLCSNDDPRYRSYGRQEFQWSVLSLRFHGPLPTHQIDLTIESEDELRSPMAVWTRLNRRPPASTTTSSTVPAAGEGNAGD